MAAVLPVAKSAQFLLQCLTIRHVLCIDIERQKIDSLRFVMCPLLTMVLQAFFAAAINSTNEANMAGGTRH